MAAVRRVCAKILLIDGDDRVLLFSGIDRTLPEEPPVWFPVGGAVEDGETLVEAAIRETGEETGFEIDVVVPPLFTRSFQWVSKERPTTRRRRTSSSGGALQGSLQRTLVRCNDDSGGGAWWH